MDPKISVVVPVYKVEKFIAECLESILSQDFDAFEVIAVDDGSPDASGTICDDFARRDPRLTVIRKENGGVATARKTGVERARGEWVTLVDADDILLPHALSTLYAATQQFPDADIVEGSAVHFSENTELKNPAALTVHGCASGPNGSRVPLVLDGLGYAISVAADDRFCQMPWAKLIRRKILCDTGAFDLPRELNSIGDDTFMDFCAATQARSVVRIFDLVYGYRCNPGGVFQGNKKTLSFDYWLSVCMHMRRVLDRRGDAWQIAWKAYITNLLYQWFVRATPGFSLRTPQVRALVAELASVKNELPPAQQTRVGIILVCTKFPFSVLPEAVYRALVCFPLTARGALRRAMKKH